MNNINFEWDHVKSISNLKKHGVSFQEAMTVFLDENSIIFDDSEHSTDEERWLILGFSTGLRMLIVCHCIRTDGDVIRIISARKATRTEEEEYAEINGER